MGPRVAKRERENGEYLAMLLRMLRAYGERVADADDWDLAEMLVLRDAVEDAIAAAVTGQRERYGRSWAWIASGLGTTRQAAFQRYGRKTETAVATLATSSGREDER